MTRKSFLAALAAPFLARFFPKSKLHMYPAQARFMTSAIDTTGAQILYGGGRGSWYAARQVRSIYLMRTNGAWKPLT